MSHLDRYTTEALEAVLADPNSAPGDRNSAPYLLKVETPEQRWRVVGEAHTLSNLLGFRHSEAVYNASQELLKNIRNGEEEKELYGERVAREYREREAEHRKIIRGY
jgi:hypothetical protein